ncbi:MAG: HAMP domain-containing protein, partial [Oxalobacteraceae bacterium]
MFDSFKNLRISVRLGIGFGAMLLLICALTALVYVQLAHARTVSRQSASVQAEKNQLSQEWSKMIAMNSTRTLALAVSPDDSLEKEFKAVMKQTSAATSEVQLRLTELETAPAAQSLLKELATVRAAYTASRDKLFAAKASDDQSGVPKLLAAFRSDFEQYNAKSTAFVAFEASQDAALNKSVDDSLGFVLTATLSMAAVCGVLAVLIGWSLTRSIVRPIVAAQLVADRIAGSDLSTDIQPAGRDEVGQLTDSLIRMQDNLRVLVGGIRLSVDSIGVASAEVAMGNNDLSARTEQAAAN